MPKPVSEGHVWGKADDNKDKSDPPKLAKADGNKDKSNSSKLTTAEWWEKSHEKNLLPASKKRAVKKPKHLDASSSEKDDPAPHALAQTKPKPKAKRSRSTPPSSMANCKKSSNVIKPASKKSKSDTHKVDDSMPNQSPDNTSINKLTYPSSQKYESTKPMPSLPGPDISVEVPITNETPVMNETPVIHTAVESVELETPKSTKSAGELKFPPEQLLKVAQPNELMRVKLISSGEWLSVPTGKYKEAFDAFVNLPSNDDHCTAVDMINGKWYDCFICAKRVPNRQGREYTVTSWNSHKKEPGHTKKLNSNKYLEQLKSIEPEKRTHKQKLALANLSKPQGSMRSFFNKVPSKKSQFKELRLANSSVSSCMTLGATAEAASATSKDCNTADVSDITPPDSLSDRSRVGSCEGIMPDFNGELKSYLKVYAVYASVASTSLYSFDYVGRVGQDSYCTVQIFSKECNRKGAKLRKAKNYGSIIACDKCFQLYILHGKKYRQTIKDRGIKLLRVTEFSKKSEITPTELHYAKNFLRTSDDTLTSSGKALKLQIRHTVAFAQYVSKVRVAVTSKEGFSPGVDTFLSNFIKHYTSSEEFRDSLIVCLMKAYVAKVNRCKNPKYAAKVINFYMALSASGDKKAFEYVSGNLVGIGLRRIQRIAAKQRDAPFISLDRDGMIERLIVQFDKVRTRANNPRLRIAMHIGIDATALVKAFQVSQSSGSIVGGCHPHHSIELEGMTSEQVQDLLKECVDGRYGDMAAEIKVCVISIQNTPPGMSPYFVLFSLPQSINENNDFGTRMLEVCNSAAVKDGNAVVLNTSTDGVSCEVQDNKSLTMKYLVGKSNQLSFPDTNHNVKNNRYQLIGGSSAAVMGGYVFDPWLLKKAGVAMELIRVEVWANNSLPLRLASALTVSKVIDKGFDDVGNTAVTIMSLLFLRLRSYAVNSKNVHWRERAVYSWASLLWFTSFRTSQSTMMTNKRNMALETIAVLFLVTRADVFQPRRATSEANEHTYGLWRMILREFNVEQLIRIIQKVNIRVNAIFEGGLVTSRSKSVFSGYQSTFPEFIGNMMEGSTTSGSAEVSLVETAVVQLWDEVSGIIYAVNSLMLHFLALFGVEEGNGLSPFAQNFSTAADLGVILNGFFKAPTPDKRGQVAEGSGEDDDGALNDKDGGDDDGADENGNSTDDLLSPSIISQHVSEINHVEGVNNKDSDGEDDIDEDCLDRAVGNLPSSSDKTDFFYCGDSSAAYEQFRALVRSNDINDVSNEALKLIKLLVLRKLEKGAVTKAAKVKSISECWFNQKTKKPTTNKEENEDAAGDSLFIRRDSLVQLGCNIGGSDAIEYFHVLAFFSKYMNRWFVTKEDEFLWEVDVGKRQNVRVLVRLLQKRRSAYVEPKLEKNGSLASHHVFCINHFRDILRVERELVEM